MLRLLLSTAIIAAVFVLADETIPAVRVVRFQIDYPNAETHKIQGVTKWNSLLRNSVLASLRFINKHWLICGGTELEKRSNDCGKAQVTGEIHGNAYRINVTFISERDPIKNAKVDATSTVFGVIQIGLKGGIFQYTNSLKVLGKPSHDLPFDEAFFCYRGATLTEGDKCRKDDSERRLADTVVPEQELKEKPLLSEERTVEMKPIDIAQLARF